MGLKNRVGAAETQDGALCLNEALLFATMCMVGFPVDVHVRDGSVYSGTFHTASLADDYGIVLKEAKLTKKGNCEANVAIGSIVNTLVILSGDLVQMVAKGFTFPADGVTGNVAGDGVEGAVTIASENELREANVINGSIMEKKGLIKNRSSAKEKNGSAPGLMPTKAVKESKGRTVNPDHPSNSMEVGHEKQGPNVLRWDETSGDSINNRQAGDLYPQDKQESSEQKFEFSRERSVCQADEVESSRLKLDPCLMEAKSVEEGLVQVKLLPNGVSCDPATEPTKVDNQSCGMPVSACTASPNAVCSTISTASNKMINIASESHCSSSESSTIVVSPKSSESNKSAKEFKLNPGAKIFSPSFANPISAIPPAVPTVTSMAYMPSNPSVLPLAAAQPEVGVNPFSPQSSVPAKFVPYTNLTAGNSGVGPQFSQPIIGHIGSRTQPPRNTSQYPPVQTGQVYAPANSQPVMVGRLGQQLIYVQPVSHDLVQNSAAMSLASGRSLLTPHYVQYPKHQGKKQVFMFMAVILYITMNCGFP
uniref:Polyadenylate-binding protein-interacting protein 4-like isoform X4 n=1 Tax=Rhizophora mucronata TaxID=61149 RepID=A0A2P2K1Q8_RHIMU